MSAKLMLRTDPEAEPHRIHLQVFSQIKSRFWHQYYYFISHLSQIFHALLSDCNFAGQLHSSQKKSLIYD